MTASPDVGTSKNTMRRIAIASGTGTTIEFYDFLIYGTAAALVFGDIFFPALGPAAATVAAFATLGVAFVARPFGSILFGHFGDRIGRKGTLVTTLLVMGIATVLIGLMPTAEQIGVAAPILVVILRVIQGLAVGGEWAGATLLAAENAPKAKRGFYAMFPQFGPAIAFSLASATFLATALLMSEEDFASYGWRIPFIASALLVAVGLYVRLKIDETPVFKGEVAKSGTSAVPFGEAFRTQPREILLGSGVMVMVFAFFYMAVSYLTSYGTATLGLPRTTVLAIGILGGVVFAVAVGIGAAYSDRVGRRRTITIANVVAVGWALVLFPILDIGTPFTFAIGVCVTLFIAGIAYGPVGAFLPELYNTRYRYTAAGLAYNVAGIIGGAIPPLIAAAIAAAFGGYAFGVFLALLCLISVACTLGLRETRDDEMSDTAGARSSV